MKAEHRHELKTNTLADALGRLVQGARQRPQSNATILWIVVGLVVATAIVWYFLRSGSGWSTEWVALDGQYDVQKLDEIARDSAGSTPARIARFQKARLELQRGLDRMYSAERDAAVKSLEDARKVFLELTPECAGQPVLAQEAMLGSAKAEEALAGIGKPDDPSQRLGSLDRALDLYRQLQHAYPDSDAGKVAAERVAQLEKSRPDVEKFYAALAKFAEGQKKPAAPSR